EEGILGHPEEGPGGAARARGSAMTGRDPVRLAATIAAGVLLALTAGGRARPAPPAAARPGGGVVGRGRAALPRPDFKKARPLYEEAVRRQPDQVHSLIRAAMLESWDSDLAPAAENYRRAVTLAPDDYDARLGLARVLSWRHEFAESITIYEGLRDKH